MDAVFGVDWVKAFGISTPLLEIFLRGTITYLALFFLLRVVLKRESGGLGITDLLVVVLIADAAQNAMAGEYTSITDGLLLVSTIIFWSYALDWLGFYVPAFHRFIQPPPLPLARDGQMLHRNMRRELVTEEELMRHLRLQGVDDLAEVKLAAMEGDGRISVISRNEGDRGAPQRPGGVA